MKDKKLFFGISIVFLFLATVGFSYAYFTATLVNKDVKEQIVTTGTLELTYNDGPEIVMNNIKPGATITKEVSVKNTGTLDASYNLVWQELVNEIIDDEMVIEATCTRLNSNGVEEGTCDDLLNTPIKRVKIKENVFIEPGVTHKYNITISFKEINADQNYNQGMNFNGVLGINEYKVPKIVNCNFDGELTPGVEYVNGQYTYRYMQKPNYSQYGNKSWEDMTENGWSVYLTDNDSTDPVTSTICTQINNIPVISTKYMFYRTEAISIDLNSFDTSNIIDMEGMFKYAHTPLLDLSNFNTSNVITMEKMFEESEIKTLDINNFDTSNVTDMSYMFWDANVTNLDLSNFDTSNVINMEWMFTSCRAKTINLLNFNTSKVTNMNWMFEGVYVVELDLSSFDTSNVTDMSSMFRSASNLVTIYASDKFVTDNVTDSTDMFIWTNKLVGGNGTKRTAAHSDKEYARIDTADTPGYFTLKNN